MKTIFNLWLPLASTFIMMSVEMPLMTALIARLPTPNLNLAAFGVMFSFLLFFEAPILMLISASNALVRDPVSYKRLRNFSFASGALLSIGLALTATTPIGHFITDRIMGLTPEIADRALRASFIVTLCPVAVAARRFYQGLLVQLGKARSVATGTVVRLCAMAGTGFVLFVHGGVDGASVGGFALVVGMVSEAFAARGLASGAVAEFLGRPQPESKALTYKEITLFYFPLALTIFVSLLSHPLTSLFVARAAEPVVSLAVLPVVSGLLLMLRTGGFAVQEVAISYLSNVNADRLALRKFVVYLAVSISGFCVLMCVTPLGYLWFRWVAGLTPELAAYAIVPTFLMALIPALGACVSYLRGVLLVQRRTRIITVSSICETGTLVLILWAMATFTAVPGAHIAAAAMTLSSVVGISVLLIRKQTMTSYE